jgi:hypothetical protein
VGSAPGLGENNIPFAQELSGTIPATTSPAPNLDLLAQPGSAALAAVIPAFNNSSVVIDFPATFTV